MNSKHSSCLICDQPKLHPVRGYYDRHGLVKCASCGFVMMEQIPTAEELQSFYGTYAYDHEGYLSPITVASYNKLLDEFEAYRSTGNLLDVGCGQGYFLQEAKKRGWNVYGSEFSDKAVEYCRSQGIEMVHGQLNASSFHPEMFDVITSFEVIEHINNPKEELTNIVSYLRKGGLHYITTPNFNSLMRFALGAEYNVIHYPEHLSYYTKRTLCHLANTHGLKIQKFLSTGISITRFKTSKNEGSEAFISESSSDEKLRAQIQSKWYLTLAKNLANLLMTWTNTGITLKGYFEKQ